GSGDRGWALRPAWIAAGLSGLLPLVATDPRLPLPIVNPASPQPGDLFVGGMRVLLGLTLFCGVVGFITPMLVDRFSSGDPEKAGRGYAVNVLGCILGPLVACFGLLPAVGERRAIVLLSLALLALAPLAAAPAAPATGWRGRGRGWPGVARAATLAAALVAVLATRDYTSLFPSSEVRRDYEATVVA